MFDGRIWYASVGGSRKQILPSWSGSWKGQSRPRGKQRGVEDAEILPHVLTSLPSPSVSPPSIFITHESI